MNINMQVVTEIANDVFDELKLDVDDLPFKIEDLINHSALSICEKFENKTLSDNERFLIALSSLVAISVENFILHYRQQSL